jgi:hypothetical protein
MDTDLGTDIGTTVEPLVDTPEARWTAWAIWSAITLVMALFFVFAAGVDTGLLPGWAVGIIVAAVLIVFGR